MFKFAMWWFVAVAVAGCANSGSEKHFDSGPSSSETASPISPPLDRATVYFYRQRVAMQDFSAVALPPLFYGLDGKMLAIMPLGSHVRLSLEPGKHTFTRFVVDGGGLFPIATKRNDLEIDLIAGKTYYVGSRLGFLQHHFEEVSSEAGAEVVRVSKLAKHLHAPVRTDVFVSRLQAAEQARKGVPASSPPNSNSPVSVTASFQDFLPSSKEVGDALEVVATVAFVALFILGLGAAGSTVSPPPSPPVAFSTPPSFSRPASPRGEVLGNSRKASPLPIEPLMEAERLRRERTVTDAKSGVKYTFEGDRVKGSDGTNYKISGTTMYSDSGQSYQVVGGKFVYASDGRSCTLIADKLHC